MNSQLKSAADAVLNRVVSGSPRVPGVVAMVTDRNETIYEGAAGERMLPEGAAMTTDSIFAIFSTTPRIALSSSLTISPARYFASRATRSP